MAYEAKTETGCQTEHLPEEKVGQADPIIIIWTEGGERKYTAPLIVGVNSQIIAPLAPDDLQSDGVSSIS